MSTFPNEGGDGTADDAAASEPSSRRERVKAGLVTVGTALHKNLSKFMDDMKQPNPNVADNPGIVNHMSDSAAEQERAKMVEEALAKCKGEMEDHLTTFLFLNPGASYEEWIQDFHPENVADGKLFSDFKDVDLRFYVADSDHRLLWNERVPPDRQIAARSYKPDADAPVDLLNDAFLNPPVAPTVDNGTNNHGGTNHTVDLLGDGWP